MRRVEVLLDRIEDRLENAPLGLHLAGQPTSWQAAEAAGLTASYAALWTRWDGLDIAQGEAIVYPTESIDAATRRAIGGGRAVEGDVVFGERGSDALVLSHDPYEEGAEVILASDDGERLPYGSTIPDLILALLAEASVLYDHEGEFRDDLYGEDGQMTAGATRRLLRRHLDADPDAPLPRVELARALRHSGEFVASSAELKRALRCAPQFSWAHFELGRTWRDLAQGARARKAFVDAADVAGEEGLAAYFLAWAAMAEPTGREALAMRARSLRPDFAQAQLAAARAAAAQGEDDKCAEHVALGLAVSPKDLSLLAFARGGEGGHKRGTEGAG
ncbi:MAG: hypothetical protein V3V08_12095 [Nannocystaceae bacterium]